MRVSSSTSCLASDCCCRLGRSGSCAARECRRVHVALRYREVWGSVGEEEEGAIGMGMYERESVENLIRVRFSA